MKLQVYSMPIKNFDAVKEFDRQVENLLKKDYPTMANLSEKSFLSKISPLKAQLNKLSFPEIDLEKGILPFVIVVKSKLISPEKMMEKTEKDGKSGTTILRPHTSQNFKAIDSISIPKNDFYLLIDIDRGKESINIPPSKAIKIIETKKRTPLTIDEGIAILTHFPEFLIKNNCFSLLASRTGRDKKVPAIWINSKKQPNLGWCWEGNPHTWLGSASCRLRVTNL